MASAADPLETLDEPRLSHSTNGSRFLARRRYLKRLAILLIVVSTVALLLFEFVPASFPIRGSPISAAASCTSSGVLPNPVGATTVNTDSTWCASSHSTWLHAGGVVSVGSASSSVSLTIKNVSVQIDDNVTIGNYGKSYRPVSLTVDNATIAFTHTDAGIRVDYVVSSMSTGDVVVIKSGSLPMGKGSGTPGACPACTLIQGNISNQYAYPIGLKVLSGTGSYKPSKIQVSGTRFSYLGNYWNYSVAALDFSISPGASYSVVAPGSFVKYVNFTGPFGQIAAPQFGKLGGPVAVRMGDTMPLQYAYFYGGYIGADRIRYLWDSWLYGLCQYMYSWSAQSRPALIQNTSFWYGNGSQHQGGGCKDIGFFDTYVVARNNFLGGGLDANAQDGDAGHNTIEGWVSGYPKPAGSPGPRCATNAGGYFTYNDNTVWGGQYSTDAIVILYCNNHINMTNDRFDTWTPMSSRGGLVVALNPSVPQIVQGGATLSNLVINNASGQYVFPGFLLSMTSPNVLQNVQINGTGAAGQCFTLGPYANSTTAVSIACRRYLYGVKIQNTTGVTFKSTVFSQVATDWSLSGVSGLALLDQAIDRVPQTMVSVQPTTVTWKWDTLNANHTYRLYRNGTTPAAFDFAADTNGTGSVVVANPSDGTYSYTLVDLSPPQGPTGTPVKLTVAPGVVTMSAVDSVRFSSAVSYTNGSQSSVSAVWSVDNGTMRSDGTFLPWSAGDWTVCAVFENLSDCANVTVVPGPMAHVSLQPASVDMQVGQSVGLGAEATDAKGNTVPLLSLTWTVVPTSLGTVQRGSVFVAQSVGSGSLVANASSGGLTLRSSIPVTVSSSALPVNSSLGDAFTLVLVFVGVGGTLIGVFYVIRRRGRQEGISGPEESAADALGYQCTQCNAEVSEADTACPNCGARFQG